MSAKNIKKAEDMTAIELSRYIDFSILKPEFTEEEIIELGNEAVKLQCATICINPGYISLCEGIVKGSNTSICPVCDFPFGTSSTESKVAQINIAAQSEFVSEIDVVANFGHIRSGKYDEVARDIKACTEAVHGNGKKIKVIFETDALTEEQIRNTCEICRRWC